ncbi:MAG TPA: ABC transporter ATP-binding protein [Candidatus Binatia bacterium]|nr:ABC transporter ATP-binding protein [Candidatus Binatia bacterium]
MDLVVENLRKFFSSGATEVQAVRDASFSVTRGTFFTLLGPSGSGKTTILRCIGGLEAPEGGEIRLGEKIYYSDRRRIALMPEERGIGMVFQSYAIWPHMTVFNNVAFPLKYGLARVSSAEIKSRVRRVLEMVQMEGLSDRMATQLSGGQQQRVALARALVSEPNLLLLDEPLSNLDAKLREDMRLEIRRIQRSLGLTTVYVTHDQAEALSMSDRIALLRGGEIVQLGGPRELYERPNDVFASAFIGTSNQLPGEILAGGLGSVRVKGRDIACVKGAGCPDNGKVIVSVRPEDINVRPANGDETNVWKGTVRQVIYFGDCVNCEIDFAGTVLRARLHPSTVLENGQEVTIDFEAKRCVAFPAESKRL